MDENEFQAVLKSYKILQSNDDLDERLRFYIIGLLEAVLARHLADVQDSPIPESIGKRVKKLLSK